MLFSYIFTRLPALPIITTVYIETSTALISGTESLDPLLLPQLPEELAEELNKKRPGKAEKGKYSQEQSTVELSFEFPPPEIHR